MLYLYHVNSLAYFDLVDQVTIGRTTGEVICAGDGRMSGKHAEITVETFDDRQVIYIQDLGSKNSTIVNRAEIAPYQKIKIKMYWLLEVGDQKFVVTENKNVNIQDLNEMIDKNLKRSVIKLVSDGSIPPSLPDSKAAPFELVQKKEALILQILKDLGGLEKSAQNEILKLEEAKEKIILNVVKRKAELSKRLVLLQTEVDEKKVEIAKINAEHELKIKKIINLNDLPSDSTEKLPE